MKDTVEEPAGIVTRRHVVAAIQILIMIVIVLFAVSSSTVKNAKNYPLAVGSGGTAGVRINRAGDAWVFGTTIENLSKTPLTINAMEMTGLENITVLEISIMEIKHGLIGAAHWPLDVANGTPVNEYPYFNARVDAEGAVIQPGKIYNLLFVLQSQEDDGSTSGLIYEYQDAYHRKYLQQSDMVYFFSGEGFE